MKYEGRSVGTSFFSFEFIPL